LVIKKLTNKSFLFCKINQTWYYWFS